MEGLALLAGFALILLGMILLLAFFMAGASREGRKGGGFTVILLGPLPIVLRHGFKISIVIAAAILVIFLLIIFRMGYGWF